MCRLYAHELTSGGEPQELAAGSQLPTASGEPSGFWPVATSQRGHVENLVAWIYFLRSKRSTRQQSHARGKLCAQGPRPSRFAARDTRGARPQSGRREF